ncbi:hypothetical protein [Endothiovibrio diazotrophicus]
MKLFIVYGIVLASFLISGCSEKDTIGQSAERVAKKGIPKIAKRIALPITIIAYSTDAHSKVSEIENAESKTDMEIASEVVGKMLQEEKEDMTDIGKDLETIYKFGIKPAASEAQKKIDSLYQEVRPIVISGYTDAQVTTKNAWKESKPILEDAMDRVSATIDSFTE